MKRNILFLIIVSSLCFSCTKASDIEVRFIQAVLIDDWDVEPTRFVECFEGKEIKDVAVPPAEFGSIYNGFTSEIQDVRKFGSQNVGFALIQVLVKFL